MTKYVLKEIESRISLTTCIT